MQHHLACIDQVGYLAEKPSNEVALLREASLLRELARRRTHIRLLGALAHLPRVKCESLLSLAAENNHLVIACLQAARWLRAHKVRIRH